MERETTAPDGNRLVSRVEVGFTHLGTLTTEEQKLLYVLYKLWEEKGKPDAQVGFSSRGLARLLRKGWGSNVIQSITKSLRRLRTIPIEWINSYHDKNAGNVVLVDRRPLTILNELRVIERHQDGSVNGALGYFKFDDGILANLKQNYTKPVCIDELLMLKSDIAQLLYTHVDLMLFDKTKYERKTRELFDDLGLKNHEYTRMYERRRALEKALREMQGVRLSRGRLQSAAIEKTRDRKDYKVVFVRTSGLQIEEAQPDGAVIASPIVINDYSQRKDALEVQGQELVHRFYKLFHGIDNPSISSKQVAQAVTLIAQHGADAAQFIVEYSATAAAETGYRPQTFGGILQYTPRAVDAFEAAQKSTPNNPPPATPPKAPEARNEEATRPSRLDSLPREEYAKLHELAVEKLRLGNPFISRHLNPDSPVIAQLVKAMMVKELETPTSVAPSEDPPAPSDLSQNEDAVTQQMPPASQEAETSDAKSPAGSTYALDQTETSDPKIAA